MDDLTRILMRLEDCARHGRYESLETDSLEIKPVPPTGSAWNSLRESVCAFLNAHGGTIVLGVRDEQGPPRRFVHTGYTEASSAPMAKLRTCFEDARKHPMDAGDCLRFEVKPFLEGQIAIIRISPLPADRKFCFFQGEAFDRIADRDEKIPSRRIQEQEERKREMETFREQRPVDDASLTDLSLQRINELVLLINQGQSMPIETIKGTLTDAEEFLRRKRFIRADGSITTLGMLVCGTHPEEHLLFRCHLDAFVEIPNVIAQDKKTFRDNILQLMEAGHAWTLRNIRTGVSPDAGGTLVSEYPDKLIRESINNAFAHRDYSINRPVQLTIQPRHSLSIRNPGHLPPELVLEKAVDPIPVRRIFSNPLARNPRLADILKLHNKWEGKGIGMSDLVNHALNNVIDVPYFTFHSAEELSLTIPAGKVLDEDTALWFELLDGFIQRKTGNRPLTEEQQTVLAYLLKSERENRTGHYTLALTPGNNHFRAIDVLKTSGLIELHPASETYKEVFVVCRELITDDHWAELRQLVGAGLADLSPLVQQVLNLISIAERHSREGGLNARQVGRLVMTRMPEEARSRGIEEFQRTIRRRIEAMSPDKKALKDISDTEWISAPDKMLSMRGSATRPLFRINRNYQPPML
jgi:ATP-dependent DNA helicase RecG